MAKNSKVLVEFDRKSGSKRRGINYLDEIKIDSLRKSQSVWKSLFECTAIRDFEKRRVRCSGPCLEIGRERIALKPPCVFTIFEKWPEIEFSMILSGENF